MRLAAALRSGGVHAASRLRYAAAVSCASRLRYAAAV